MKRAALQLYRLAVLLVIAGLIRAHAVRLAAVIAAGLALAFTRKYGRQRQRRDAAAALLVALAAVLSWKYQALHAWLIAAN